MPSYFPENNTPLPEDTEVRSLQKINDLLKTGIVIGEVEIVPGSDPLPTTPANTSTTPLFVTPANTATTPLFTSNSGSNAGTPSDFTSSTGGVIAASNANRRLLTIYNEGPSNLYVLYGGATVSPSVYSVIMRAGDYLEVNNFTGQVNGLFAASGSVAKVSVIQAV